MNNTETKAVIASVVSNETGEVINEIYEGDRIIRKKDKHDNYIHDFRKNDPFVKLYIGVNELRKVLSLSEFAVAISLADFICYDDCLIRKGGNNNGHLLTVKELADDMNIPYESLRKTMRSLKKKGIIGEHKTGCPEHIAITVNPNIYHKGVKVNETIAALFENVEIQNKRNQN